MSKLKTIIYLLKNNRKGIGVAIFDNIVKIGAFNKLSDEAYVSLMYRVHVGKKLNLTNPRGFNEKLQWLKLNDHKDIYTNLVDKAYVKDIVAEVIGKDYIIPTYGTWERFDDIDFNTLPDKFVLKCTHDSGSVCVCKDKDEFDYDKARKKLSKALKRNLYYWGREWPYKNVKPRIIAEKYLDDGNKELVDYKFMVFNGVVKCLFTVTNRFSQNGMHVTFYDLDWNIMPFERHYKADKIPIEKPLSFDTMMRLSEKLAENLKFARIDFYEVQGHPFFGEITLCPGNGIEEFNPEEWDYKLGDWLDLSGNKVGD